jgi:hypothetical protein
MLKQCFKSAIVGVVFLLFAQPFKFCPAQQIIDVGLIEVLSPRGFIRDSTVVTPMVRAINLGTIQIGCEVFLEIDDADYSDTVAIFLNPGETFLVTFRPWTAAPPDEYEGEVWIESLPGDTNLLNNELDFEFVVANPNEFIQGPSLPPGTNPKKKVKSGGSVVRAFRTGLDQVVDTLIFAFKGNNTRGFFAYDVNKMNWQVKESIPFAPDKAKRVKAGASLCYDGEDTIFALKGNNTLEFWAYSVSNDTWVLKPNVPLGSGKRVKGGAGLAFVTEDGKKYVYCLKGNKTNEFYKFDVANNNWMTTIRPAPGGVKGFGSGSCIVYDSINKRIYALQGTTNQFFYYDVVGDSWVNRTGMPFDSDILETENKKAKDGTAMTIDDSVTIYALKGGTQEFWSYHIPKDSWFEKDTIPLGLARKKVKGGGALAFIAQTSGTKGRGEGEIYALKGNNTDEMWVFLTEAVPPEEKDAKNKTQQSFAGTMAIFNNSSPLPSGKIKVYDVTGRLIKQFSPILNQEWVKGKRIGLSNLNTGVYFLRFESKGFCSIKKLIVRQ